MGNNINNDAIAFKKAIENAKWRIDIRDRMHDFPRGCCDDATDLFAHFLFQKYSILSERVDGSFYDEDPESSDKHTWLEVKGIIIDLTAEQCGYNDLYIGSYNNFYKRYDTRKMTYRGFMDLSDGCWKRMQGLYDTIMSFYQELESKTWPIIIPPNFCPIPPSP